MVQGFVVETRMEMTTVVADEVYGIDGDPWQSAQPLDGMQQGLDL